MLLNKRGILEDSAVSVDPVYEDGEPEAKILKTFFFVKDWYKKARAFVLNFIKADNIFSSKAKYYPCMGGLMTLLLNVRLAWKYFTAKTH